MTLGAILSLIFFGIALRGLAPDRWTLPVAARSRPALASPPCTPACWSGEACQLQECVWQPPKEAGHLPAAATAVGPFELPKDVSDILPLDSDRFAASTLAGMQVFDAQSGQAMGLVTEAPQLLKLHRVGDVVYAVAPQRIYVIEAKTAQLLKAIELGSPVGNLALGASGRRALVSLPAARSVAVLSTEFHAEIDRILFGDDPVGPVGADETGQRALTTTGQVPSFGARDASAGGAVYAFDPSRLATRQDRVRASVPGNPVAVLMTPDGESSWVVARSVDALVPLEWLPSGAVRERERIPTCDEPEQIELVRRGRRALVRCNAGKAIEVFDLRTRAVVKRVDLPGRVFDMIVAPDGSQAVTVLGSEGAGSVALVDLETYAVRLLPLGGEPSHVRMSPDGRMAVVVSDRSKVAWVVR